MSTRSEEVQKSKTDRAAKMKGRAKAGQRNHPTNITASETVQPGLRL